MRRLIFFSLVIALAALIAARSALPPPETAAVTASGAGYGYNYLGAEPGTPTETAGSGMVSELNAYYLFRAPTAKSALTGALRGRNLILICAENWSPDPTDRRLNPCLHRLWKEGARFTRVYRPDWYQGSEGREFALLTGLMPTRVSDMTALAWVGAQGVYIPYTLARCLGDEGYAACAYVPGEGRREAYEALGFTRVTVSEAGAEALAADTPAEYLGGGPFFVFYLWEEGNCEPALGRLTEALAAAGQEKDTVLCLLTGNGEDFHGQLFLWAVDTALPESDLPCSELDAVPTLLNLFGAAFDSRFLSGRDLFAPAGAPGEADSTTPLVSLYGSAYSDWITDAGSYLASDRMFWPEDGAFQSEEETISYAQRICGLVYDRYIFARRALECDYFSLVPG